MFDALKGMTGIAGLMKDLPRIKAKFEDVKSKLGRITEQAESGDGAVRAVVNGQLRLVSLHLDPNLLASFVQQDNPKAGALAEELIAAAVNAAMEKAKQRAQQELADAARELNLPLPAGALGGLLG